MPARVPPETWKKFDALLKAGWNVTAASRECGIDRATGARHAKGVKKRDGLILAKLAAEVDLPGVKSAHRLSNDAKRALVDFAFFRLTVLGRASMPWQVKAAEDVVALLESPSKEYVVINVPPGAGKSTLFTHDIPLWLICRNRSIRILIGSLTERQAKMYTGRLRDSLERTRPYLATDAEKSAGAQDAAKTVTDLFGRFKPTNPKVWRVEEFTVAQPNDDAAGDKENTVAAYGKDGGVLGTRVDFVIWDDLIDNKNQRTVEAREELKQWWKSTAETRLEPGGLMVLQGQRMGSDDLYRFALDLKDVVINDEGEEDVEAEPPPKYKHIIYKAHYDELCTGRHPKGSPAWPDGCLLDPYRLPWVELLRAKKNGVESFLVQYQQEDTDPANVLVQKLWVTGGRDEHGVEYPGCWDNDRGIAELPRGLVGEVYSFATADPSPTMFWSVQWWCVARGSKVVTQRGEIPVEQVSLADQVLTRVGWKPVQHVTHMGSKRTIDVGLSNGRTLRVTPDHKVLTSAGWVEAGSLRLGSALVACDAGADAAYTLPPADTQVASRVGVTGGAMRPFDLSLYVGGSSHVGAVVLDRQVAGVAARGVAAQMTDFRSVFWDVSDEGAVAQPMGESFAGAAVDYAITEGGARSVPQPALAVDGDAGHEVCPVWRYPSVGGDRTISTDHTYAPAWVGNGVPTLTDAHVVSLTDGATTDVYDIGVFGQHEFTCEGVIVHNCLHHASGQFFLMDHVRKKMRAPELLDWDNNNQQFVGLMEQWQLRSYDLGLPISHWIVEDNAAQRFLLQFEHVQRWQRKHASSSAVSVVAHQTHRNKSDPKYGVQSLGPLYRAGAVRLPGKQMDGSRIASMKLVDEVTKWPEGSTDDCVMAQWFGTWNAPNLFHPGGNVYQLRPNDYLSSKAARGLPIGVGA